VAWPRISDLEFVTDDVAKMLLILTYNKLPGGGITALTYTLECSRPAMSSSNRHVMLRLIVFEIFAVKWQKLVSERPKIGLQEPLS